MEQEEITVPTMGPSEGYTKVQCIAYEINTFPVVRGGTLTGKESFILNGNPIDLPVWEFEKAYAGDSDDAKDTQKRLELMKDAMNSAYLLDKIDKSNFTLKIFMAPEFYFRGIKGAYGFKAYDHLVEELRAATNEKKWKDWLFVFGSILVTLVESSTSTTPSLINNVVLIQKGGGDREARVVVKEYKSPIDFIEDETLETSSDSKGDEVVIRKRIGGGLSDSKVSHPEVGDSGSGKEHQSKAYQAYEGLGIFEEDGITFGVEVCLDHAYRRLRKSAPAKGQSFVQVQLIPSAGMNIRKDATVAVKDGVVFNCDGNKVSDVKIVEKACTGKTLFTRARDAEFKTLVVTKNEEQIHTTGKLKKVFEEFYNHDDEGAKVVAYEAVVLPASKLRGKGWFSRAPY